MKLVVGLGNPGRKYAETRHNVGYEVIVELARRYATGKPRSRFQGEAVEATIAGQPVLLLQPCTYMNRSGSSVQPARDFYKMAPEDLLIVCDDFNLPVGRLRFRPQGSSGGQKGLEDIIRRLGTSEFARLRIGIGPVPPERDPASFVLSKFTKQELPEIEHATVRAADGVADWVQQGVQFCMNRYNAS